MFLPLVDDGEAVIDEGVDGGVLQELWRLDHTDKFNIRLGRGPRKGTWHGHGCCGCQLV